MVNTQQLQGTWNRLRGEIKEKWANLTDEDLQLQGGNIDQVVGKIQQKTGESREVIEQFLNHLTSRSASVISQTAEAAGQYVQQAGRQVRERFGDVSQQFSDGYETMERAVRQRPTQSVAAALGVGLVVGIMVGLALRSR
jgi:uncharacterized protein YjbJ (UPF0337 family)